MTRDLTGRIVLVTGASAGIGRVLAQRYARAGAHLVVAARRAGELRRTAELVTAEGARCLAVVADVSREQECVRLIREALSRYGRVDVLVNNAGTPGRDEAVHEATVQNWTDSWTTNLLGPMILSREALREAMIPARRGNIQFLSSAAARSVLPRKAHYAAAKLALIPLAQTLAVEAGPFGVRVNTLVVGTVSGKLIDDYLTRVAAESGDGHPTLRASIEAHNALGRIVEPEEVADVSTWLASDASSAVTGQAVNVTAGGLMS